MGVVCRSFEVRIDGFVLVVAVVAEKDKLSVVEKAGCS